MFPSGVFASSPKAANSSGILCSGASLSGKCAIRRPETDMSLFSTYEKIQLNFCYDIYRIILTSIPIGFANL